MYRAVGTLGASTRRRGLRPRAEPGHRARRPCDRQRRGRDRGDPRSGGLRGGVQGGHEPGRARGARAETARATEPGRLGGRGPRHRHRGGPRCCREGLSDGLARGKSAAACKRARHGRPDRAPGPDTPRRPGHGARVLAADGRARSGGARHQRPRCGRGSRTASSSWSSRRADEPADRRGGGLSERRQVDAREPPVRHARDRGPRGRGRDPRPQGGRGRLERRGLHAGGHRRRGLRGRAPDGGGDPAPGADRASGRRPRPARGGRPRRPASGRRRAGEQAARRRRAGDRGRQQGR